MLVDLAVAFVGDSKAMSLWSSVVCLTLGEGRFCNQVHDHLRRRFDVRTKEGECDQWGHAIPLCSDWLRIRELGAYEFVIAIRDSHCLQRYEYMRVC